MLIAANAEGKEVGGRLAARIGSALLVDVVDVKPGAKVVHSIFGGAYTVDAEPTGELPVITVRAGAVEPVPPTARASRSMSRFPRRRERHQDHLAGARRGR